MFFFFFFFFFFHSCHFSVPELSPARLPVCLVRLCHTLFPVHGTSLDRALLTNFISQVSSRIVRLELCLLVWLTGRFSVFQNPSTPLSMCLIPSPHFNPSRPFANVAAGGCMPFSTRPPVSTAQCVVDTSPGLIAMKFRQPHDALLQVGSVAQASSLLAQRDAMAWLLIVFLTSYTPDSYPTDEIRSQVPSPIVP